MYTESYISTTSESMAKEFTYKQARALINNKKKRYHWITSYYMKNLDTGEVGSNLSPYYKGNGGVYLGENDIDFDEKMLVEILKEKDSILGLCGWNQTQLDTYKNKLNTALSKYDSAMSDIVHVLEEYKVEHGKNPPAHKMTKLYCKLTEVRIMHRNIKQCFLYIEVMSRAITQNYTLEKLKLELSKAERRDYKGRTEYYQEAIDILYN